MYPDAKRVLLTAYADTEAAIRAINSAKIHYYLNKPWDPPEEKLYPVLDDLLETWKQGYKGRGVEGIQVIGLRWSPDRPSRVARVPLPQPRGVQVARSADRASRHRRCWGGQGSTTPSCPSCSLATAPRWLSPPRGPRRKRSGIEPCSRERSFMT